MLRLMCGVSLMDRVRSKEIRERVGVESWVRRQRLLWFEHIERKEETVKIQKTGAVDQGKDGWMLLMMI